jgi:diguanylate cyclase (GGDEF)-like protein
MPGDSARNGRALAAIALLAVISIAIAGSVFLLTEADQNDIASASARLDRLVEIAHDATGPIRIQEAALDDYILSGDTAALARYRESVSAHDSNMRLLAGGDFQLPEIESALATLDTIDLAWRTTIAEPAITARDTHDQRELDRFALLAVNDHRSLETAEGHIEQLLDDAQTAIDRRAASISNARLVGIAVGLSVFVAAFALALVIVFRFGRALERDARQASVLNRFTEVTSFAGEDREVAAANLTALGRLVHPDASVAHVLNRSLDRAVPEAKTGNAIAEVIAMGDLSRCAGMLRGSMYVSDDLADDLSVHCPVYPATRGTLACVPLTSGETVGTVHLYWSSPNALRLEVRAAVSRVTEHAALAIGNRRLLSALQGQANTDPRTGLANSRAFDLAVERTLAGRAGHESVSLLMLDVDHFKLFNDRHGHPAGDEALRTFATVLRSCMRDGDVAARYGGEEFAVLLPGVDRDAALTIADRIRTRTESTIVSLSPGLTDRITVSIGVASAPEQALERLALLRLADEALYQAKAAGRNRVETIASALPEARGPVVSTPARARRGA